MDINDSKLTEVKKRVTDFNEGPYGCELGIIISFLDKVYEKYASNISGFEQQEREGFVQIAQRKEDAIRTLEQEVEKEKLAVTNEKNARIKELADVKREVRVLLDYPSKDKINITLASMKWDTKEKYEALINKKKVIGEKILALLDEDKARIERGAVAKAEIIDAKAKSYMQELDLNERSEQEKLRASLNVSKQANRDAILGELNAFFSDEKFIDKMRELWKLANSYGKFSIVEQIPRYLYICNLRFLLLNGRRTYPEFCQLFRQAVEPVHELGFSEDGRVEIPYFIDKNVGLLLGSNNIAITAEQAEKILLMQFMAFPAGRLEIVMIDPQLSACFSAFSKLGGEDNKQIIDTKTWTTISDIHSAMVRVRERMETVVQSYGVAERKREEREKRENFRILAIADFPANFSYDSLIELQTIIDKGPSYGIFTFLMTNGEKLGQLDEKEKVVARNIIKKFQFFSVINGTLQIQMQNKKEELGENAIAVSYPVALPDFWDKINTEQVIRELSVHTNDYKSKLSVGYEIIENYGDVNSWLSGNSKNGIEIPIGIIGEDNVVNVILGRNGTDIRHHVLVEGIPGAGKSVLLHTIILSTLIKYAPSEVQIYALDFKVGDEFKDYTNFDLPSFRYISIQKDREAGREILKQVMDEMERRYKKFKEKLSDRDIAFHGVSAYRSITNQSLPRILLVIDEFGDLVSSNDSISGDCIKYIHRIAMQGRAAGIHVILSAQSFNLPTDLKSLFGVRIALNGSKNILDSSSDVTNRLQAGVPGQAIYNDNIGNANDSKVFRTAKLKDRELETLRILSEIERDEVYRQGINTETQVLSDRIQENIVFPINDFVYKEKKPGILSDNEQYCPLFLGECFDASKKLDILLKTSQGSNLLVASASEKCARAIFLNSLTSILYHDLGCETVDSSRKYVYYLDLGDNSERLNDEACKLLSSELESNIEYRSINDEDEVNVDGDIYNAQRSVDEIYNAFLERKNGRADKIQRIYFFILGMDYVNIINSELSDTNSLYTDHAYLDEQKLSYTDKLKIIMSEGSMYGINCIAWVSNFERAKRIFGDQFVTSFELRVVNSQPDEIAQELVEESTVKELDEFAAYYKSVKIRKSKKFKVFEEQSISWIEKFIDAYLRNR